MRNRPNETDKQGTKSLFVFRLQLLIVLLGSAMTLYAQRTIRGVVKDNLGEPVMGASVVLVGTTNGSPTDIDGNFSLDGVPNNGVLKVSFMGYKTKTVKVGTQSVINIVIDEDMQNLDEVVVVGYGTMRRSSITGSTSRVDTESMEGFPSTNVADAMQGRAAGVYITPSRQPGEDPNILIRGTRSLKAGNSPLIIVDGMPGGFENLSSEDIASMEVLKDAAATAIYGSRAANGVILITTKQAKKGESRFQIDVNSYVGINNSSLSFELT